jgi:hypothetical protein
MHSHEKAGGAILLAGNEKPPCRNGVACIIGQRHPPPYISGKQLCGEGGWLPCKYKSTYKDTRPFTSQARRQSGALPVARMPEWSKGGDLRSSV